MTDGDIRDRDGDGINERVDENGNQKILYQMADRLDQILNPDKGSEAGLLTKGDMPLPTWLVNAESDDSLTYWKQVNRADSADASVTALGSVPVSGQVYSQKEDTWPPSMRAGSPRWWIWRPPQTRSLMTSPVLCGTR